MYKQYDYVTHERLVKAECNDVFLCGLSTIQEGYDVNCKVRNPPILFFYQREIRDKSVNITLHLCPSLGNLFIAKKFRVLWELCTYIDQTAVPCNCNVRLTLAKKAREFGCEKITMILFSFLNQKVAPQPVVVDGQTEGLIPAPRSIASNSANKFQDA